LNKLVSNHLITFLSRRSNKGVIFTLHRVLPLSEKPSAFNNYIEMSASKLEEVIINLKKLNARFVSLKGIADSLNRKSAFKHPVIHLSFDDGYHDNYSVAFEILKKYKVCFSIFITSDFINCDVPFAWWYIAEYIISNRINVCFEKYNFSINEATYNKSTGMEIFGLFRNFILDHLESDRNYFREKLFSYMPSSKKEILPGMLSWEQINEMLGSGLCELGIHTKDHARFSDLSTEERVAQIEHCKKEIFTHTGVNAKYFAYPFGSKADIGVTEDLEEIMSTHKIDLAVTTMPGELNYSSSKFLIPRFILNNNASMYTLKTRLNGSYQRGLAL
jgi:peptidoglycan/xylan/chitin deacetylase (PgdA/CDA1 family)